MFDEKRFIIGLCVIVCLLFTAGYFVYDLSPASSVSNAPAVIFSVNQGDGFRTIINNLYAQGLIQSHFAVEAFAVFDGDAFHMQPGLYRLSPSMSAWTILNTISSEKVQVTVTIPEGSNIYDIDRILSENLVIQPGALIAAASGTALEGKLFPDTYDFFTKSSVTDVIQKLLDNFNAKAAPVLAQDPKNAARNLIIASILEKEVASSTDDAIVAGILEKRLAAGIPLDVDATICYIKQQENPTSTADCVLTAADLKIDSPYNTYLYKGLPPTPISNPGITTINAAINPQSSPYWYYLSDPTTGETIYAVTLAQQNANVRKYLGG